MIVPAVMLRGEGSKGSKSQGCKTDEFLCKKCGTCIPSKLRCNGKVDCPAGDDSDERKCRRVECSLDDYKCILMKAMSRQQFRDTGIFL